MEHVDSNHSRDKPSTVVEELMSKSSRNVPFFASLEVSPLRLSVVPLAFGLPPGSGRSAGRHRKARGPRQPAATGSRREAPHFRWVRPMGEVAHEGDSCLSPSLAHRSASRPKVVVDGVSAPRSRHEIVPRRASGLAAWQARAGVGRGGGSRGARRGLRAAGPRRGA